jgi:uncharacterized protein YjbI with pentapeptide repeats
VNKTFEETISYLRELGLVFEDQDPKLPSRMPQYDDEDPCGLSVFRMGIEAMNLSKLDMRRTFFGRSEIANCDFSSTDLSESNLCWNDFIDVNFSRANLSRSDLRASLYQNVNFSLCDLSNADLRLASFENCDFESASMKGTKITKAAGAVLNLSQQQKDVIDWQNIEGEEPMGG